MPERVEVSVAVADLPAFRSFLGRVEEFITEYAWHDRMCSAIDGDGEWRRGNPDCTCGYDEALTKVTQGLTAE